jgi:hypothetical protein
MTRLISARILPLLVNDPTSQLTPVPAWKPHPLHLSRHISTRYNSRSKSPRRGLAKAQDGTSAAECTAASMPSPGSTCASMSKYQAGWIPTLWISGVKGRCSQSRADQTFGHCRDLARDLPLGNTASSLLCRRRLVPTRRLSEARCHHFAPSRDAFPRSDRGVV